MTFAEKMRGLINKGVGVSSDLAAKASGKAKELGAMGMVKLEIVQLESKAGKLIAKLGKEIERVRERIELKEKEYRSISTKKKATS
jgi:uncharacterized protein YxjI